ncbi:SpoIIE family protein phosphatase [Luteolibacter sp. LG18]|uniref:SpoIIE family protein phosphatase n=1 Tax=Luteolibacter sp. LG18 TaxID=2819286 RepID=UPI0030C7121C
MSKDGQSAPGEVAERMVLALKASNEGIWDWYVGKREIYYSRRIIEFLECPEMAAPNLFLAPYDHVHPEERTAFERAVLQSLETGGPEKLSVDCRVRSGSGTWRWLRIRGTVVRDREGHATRIAGSMIDISLRKGAEAQLEEERHLLKQLIDHVPLQIYFKDLDSHFVLANRKMGDWMGVGDPTDLLGKHDRDFFNEAHWGPAAYDERQILETGQPITDKLERETWRAGEETWVQTSKFPWRDRLGRVKGTFGVSGDVTDLVVAQKKAAKLASALSVRNQAYEEELHLAREIQQALANGQFPTVDNFGFGARYVPISGLAGDFFEVVPVSDRAAGLLICDVMGHGVRSALIVAMLRGLLEKQRSQAADPGLFLHGLNEGLCSILSRAGATMFATAFYAVADRTTGTLTYACAGHPGAVISGRNGVRQLATEKPERGPGLGLIATASYPVGSVPLEDVDRLILFTDGILEAQNGSGEAFFEQRLMEIVGASCGQPLDAMLDAILGSVLAFSESRHFDDDVCLLGMEVGVEK